MKKYLFVIFIVSISFSNDFIPENYKTINYTQIFFKWPQINNASNYKLIINDNENIFSSFDNSTILEGFNFGENYVWQVCGYDEFENLIQCYDTLEFSINNLPSNYPTDINLISINEEGINEGITMLDFESLHFSAALNMYGEPIWFADKNQFTNEWISVTEILNSGNIIGFGQGKGYEFTLDSDVVFETSSSFGVHHSIHKTDNNTYFFIDAESQELPCPLDCYNPLDSTIEWRGDRFIEVDSNNNILWDWNTFVNLSMNEFNPMWTETSTSYFDWTHSNSVYFNVENNTVYASIRNLSRISAIDYSTQEIIWNLGNPDFMDSIYFDNYFNFSHQHSAQIFNENILFFDNGRDNNPEVSRCLEISIDNNGEPQLEWEFILPDSLLTLSRGECDRLENGNTLITAGRTGNILEVDNNEIVWQVSVMTESLSPLIDDQSVSIYRSQRINNLYPNEFSFEITNLSGDFGSYILENDEQTLDIKVFNKGWVGQEYIYELSSNDILLFNDSINAANNSTENILIDINNFSQYQYNFIIYPQNNIDKMQSLSFCRNFILGDINSDDLINILDVVGLINHILYDNYYIPYADINQDDTINIIDVVQLINYILNN